MDTPVSNRPKARSWVFDAPLTKRENREQRQAQIKHSGSARSCHPKGAVHEMPALRGVAPR